MAKIVSREKLTAQHTAYVIEAPELAAAVRPGHLVRARIGKTALLCPYAVADFDRDKGTAVIVAAAGGGEGGPGAAPGAGGETGHAAAPEAGEGASPAIEIEGPAGGAADIGKSSRLLCAAEGLGVAALYPRLREFKESGVYTIVIAGYPSRDEMFWRDRLDGVSDELYVVTDDGSYGIKGPVKHTIRAVCENDAEIDRALFIGPLKLLKDASNVTRGHGVATSINLGAVIDGDIRAQGGNVLEAVIRYVWDNPSDLDGHAVDFDELVQRLGIEMSK